MHHSVHLKDGYSTWHLRPQQNKHTDTHILHAHLVSGAGTLAQHCGTPGDTYVEYSSIAPKLSRHTRRVSDG
jgi:hypothetical protein